MNEKNLMNENRQPGSCSSSIDQVFRTQIPDKLPGIPFPGKFIRSAFYKFRFTGAALQSVYGKAAPLRWLNSTCGKRAAGILSHPTKAPAGILQSGNI